MAKILISTLQVCIGNNVNNLTCFYDSLNKELIKNGNDVLFFNTIQEIYLTRFINSQINKIKNFNPDIIFTFNNRISDKIIKITDCPIVLFEADCADYFCKRDLIK